MNIIYIYINMTENDVSFLLGNRLNRFDVEYVDRKLDYTVPRHISEFESSSDKWVRRNLKRNNLVLLHTGNTDNQAVEHIRDNTYENPQEWHKKSIFTEMNSSDLNQEDTRTLDYRLKEINIGLIKNLLTEAEIKLNQDNDPYKNVIHKLSASDLLKGIQEINHISNIFFSDTNIKAVHQAIKSNIKKTTGTSIDNQLNNSLFIIMRSIYLQYGNSHVLSDDIVKEIRRLNEKVIEYCISNIEEQLKQYQGYKQKISSLPIPLEHPIYDNKNNFTYDSSNLL